MRIVGFILRVILILVIAAAVGVWTSNRMLLHSHNANAPLPELRLAAYTGGLFAGGSAAALVAVLMLLGSRRSR